MEAIELIVILWGSGCFIAGLVGGIFFKFPKKEKKPFDLNKFIKEVE